MLVEHWSRLPVVVAALRPAVSAGGGVAGGRGVAVVDAGSEHAGLIYGEGTGTFRVDFVLTYETMVEEDPGPTREAAYSYTCRAP